MKTKGFLPALVCAAVLLTSCATVQKSEVEVIETKPAVSKTVKETAPPKGLKRKVAIARFSNETKYGQSFFFDENKDFVGKQAMDILSAKLAVTEKFLLLERADLEKINKELKIGTLAGLNIPADYLIVGSVSEFGRKTAGDVGLFSRTKKQEAHAKVNIRLIEVATGQIIYSAEGEGNAFSEVGSVMGVGSRADYDSSLNDKAISAAIGKLVNNIVETLMDKPWRSYILSFENGIYIISGGKSQGIKEGDVFSVYRKGKRVINPQTGLPLDLPGQLLGKVKVLSLSGSDPANEIALSTVVDGSIPQESFSDIYIQEL